MLTHLTLSCFRNITSAELVPASKLNLILGENGSGKTSLLEAIFMLSMGRSFRSRSLKHAIQLKQRQLILFTRANDNTPIGLQYDHAQGLLIRLNNAPLKKLSELVAYMPLQFIPANCHQFFELGPRYRRKMVDWGVFHVEHTFNLHWQSYKKILQQRNAAIRQHKPDNEITLWDKQLIIHGQKITEQRRIYLEQLTNAFLPFFEKLCPELSSVKFSLRFNRGWNKDEEYGEHLKNNLQRDRALGYSRSGPHAADWSLRIDGYDPYEMLSRGQQKLFFLALSMAQITLVSYHLADNTSLLLIDDLSSELDWNHQKTVIEAIRELPVQAFITSTNNDISTLIIGEKEKVFHVKHGMVAASSQLPINNSSDIVE